MSANHRAPGRSGGCRDFRASFQDYLDGTLPRAESLALFLHLRGCSGCQAELDTLKHVFDALESLPETKVPDDFNQRIMASIPLAAYREMEPLRRDRVPVIFTEEFLPAAIRSVPIRVASGVVAVAALGGVLTSLLPDGALAITVAGGLPEVLVRIQNLGRWAVLAVQESDSG